MKKDQEYMEIALVKAREAYNQNETPVGAIIVYKDEVIAQAANQREEKQSVTAHAEVLAIEEAARVLGTWKLNDCTMYVTLEPCLMCAGTIIQARIDRVVFGASDRKGGSIISNAQVFDIQGWNHYPSYTSGVLEEECSSLLTQFFREKRSKDKL